MFKKLLSFGIGWVLGVYFSDNYYCKKRSEARTKKLEEELASLKEEKETSETEKES